MNPGRHRLRGQARAVNAGSRTLRLVMLARLRGPPSTNRAALEADLSFGLLGARVDSG